MERIQNQTVKDLRALAKQRGLTGYSRLRKAELIQLLLPAIRGELIPGLSPPTIEGTPVNIDEPIPNIETVPLIPQTVRRGVKTLKDMASKAKQKVQQKISDFANWLMDHVPTPKVVDPIFKSVKDKILSLYSTKQQTSKPKDS